MILIILGLKTTAKKFIWSKRNIIIEYYNLQRLVTNWHLSSSFQDLFKVACMTSFNSSNEILLNKFIHNCKFQWKKNFNWNRTFYSFKVMKVSRMQNSISYVYLCICVFINSFCFFLYLFAQMSVRVYVFCISCRLTLNPFILWVSTVGKHMKRYVPIGVQYCELQSYLIPFCCV